MSELELLIASKYSQTGFTKAIANLTQMQQALQKLARDSNKVKDLVSALKNYDKEVSRQSKDNNRADKVKKETQAYQGLAAQLHKTSQLSKQLQQAIGSRTGAQDKLEQSEKSLLDIEQRRKTLLKELHRLNQDGQKDTKDYANAQRQLTQIEKDLAREQQNLAAMRKRAEADTKTANQSLGAYLNVAKKIKALEASGVRVPTQLSNRAAVLKSQIDDYKKLGSAIGEIDRLSKRAEVGMTFANGVRKASQNTAQLLTLQKEVTTELKKQNGELIKAHAVADKARVKGAKTAEATRLREEAAAAKLADKEFSQFAKQIAKVRDNTMSLLPLIQKLANLLTGGLARGFKAASGLIGNFTSSAASRFATLRSALDSTGRAFLTFGGRATAGLTASANALQRTAAGWSLLMGGQMVTRLGRATLGGFGFNLNDYMQYEKAATKTAISGNTSMDVINDLVFGIMRGSLYGSPIKDYKGKDTLPVNQFSAEELAQGAYYLTSAIGLNLQDPNQTELQQQQTRMSVAQMLAPMLQVAAFTRTDPETMIKGGLNIGMEFGYDPRDPSQSNTFAQIAATMGYLANISTMEIPDIQEAFKMVGPRFHNQIGDSAGDGLSDAMAAVFFASEVGLKGGNVGRGLDQVMARLLTPTGPALESAGKAFGTGKAFTKEEWESFFFNESGNLEGGFIGFLEKVMDPKLGPDADRLLAELFTQNADRTTTGIIAGLRENPERWKDLTDALKLGEETGDYTVAMQLLEKAGIQTSNTLFTAWQKLQNSWMELTVRMVDSIKGPLMGAFNFLGDALRQVADLINMNPIIGKLIATFAVVIGTILTVVGAFLTLAGTIIILQRAFLMTHGAVQVFMAVFAAIPHVLAVGLPLLLAVAAAAIALHTAWETNFLGIQDLVERVQKDGIAGVFMDMMRAMQPVLLFLDKTQMAFREFVNGILLGRGSTNNLGAWLEETFGTNLYKYIYGHLKLLQGFMRDFRSSVVDFFSGIRNNAPEAMDALRAVQGALEQLILGFMDAKNAAAIGKIGEWLGIDELVAKVEIVAAKVRSFFAGALTGTIQGFVGTLRIFGSVVNAVFQGIVAVLDNFGISVQNIGQVLGIVFGSKLALSVLGLIVPFQNLIAVGVQAIAMLALMTIQAIAAGLAFLFANPILLVVAALVLFAVATKQGGELLGNLIQIVNNIIQVVIGLVNTFGFLLPVLASVFQAVINVSTILAESEGIWRVIAAVIALAFTLSLAQAVMGILGFLGPFGMMMAGLVGLPPVLRNSAVGFGILAAAIILLGPHFDTLSGWLDGAIGKLDQLTNGMGDETALGLGLGLGTGAGRSTLAMLARVPTPFIVGAAAAAALWPTTGADGEYVPQRDDYIASIYGSKNWATESASQYSFPNEAAMQGWILDAFVQVLPKELAETARLYNGEMPEQVVAEIYNAILNAIPEEVGADSAKFLAEERTKQVLASASFLYEEQAQKDIAARSAAFNAFVLGTGNGLAGQLGPTSSAISPKLNVDQSKIDAANAVSAIDDLLKTVGLSDVKDSAQQWLDYIGINVGNGDFDIDLNKLQSGKYDMRFADFYGPEMAKQMAALEGHNNLQGIPVLGGQIPGLTLADTVGAAQSDATAKQQQQEDFEAWRDQAFANLPQMDFSAIMQSLLPTTNLTGNGVSGISAMMKYGDSFTLPEGTWADINEIIADYVGFGGGTDDVTGINFKSLLANDPGIQNVAAEMGTTVEELLKNVPTFVHDEAAMPVALAELFTDGLAKIPTEVYTKLDHFGINQGWSDLGIEWTELAQFAVSKAMSGESWDLADFVAAKWGVEREEALAALRSEGLTGEEITSAIFDGTQLSINSMGGKVSILTPEWYEWWKNTTNNGANNIIKITQAEFDKIPDAIKLTLSANGVTFVIDDGVLAKNAADAANKMYQAYVDAVNVKFAAGDGTPDGTGGPFPDGGVPLPPEVFDIIQGQKGVMGMGTSVEALGLPSAESVQIYADTIVTTVTGAINEGITAEAMAPVTTNVNAVFSQLPSIGGQAGSALTRSFHEGVALGLLLDVLPAVNSIVFVVTGALSTADDSAFGIGINIGVGLATGIRNAIPLVAQAASEMASAANNTTTGQLALHSPSRVFIDHGINVAAGLAMGIEEGTPMAVESSRMMAVDVHKSGTSSSSQSTSVESGASTVNINFYGDVHMRDEWQINDLADAVSHRLGWKQQSVNRWRPVESEKIRG